MPVTFKLPASRVLLFLLVGFTIQCVSSRSIETVSPSFKPKEELYLYNYDKVWRATQISLSMYPIKINNIDTGHIQTQFISTDDIWKPAHPRANKKKATSKYLLKVNVIRGKAKGKKVVKVTILKQSSEQNDFFSESQSQPSDGIEEDMLLYRIKRELLIERALEKANRTKRKSNNKKKK